MRPKDEARLQLIPISYTCKGETGTDLINKKVVENFQQSYDDTKHAFLSAKKKMSSWMGGTLAEEEDQETRDIIAQARAAGQRSREEEKKRKKTIFKMIGMYVCT